MDVRGDLFNYQLKQLSGLPGKFKEEYDSAVRNCDWDDDVAKVLKQKISDISVQAYFDVRRAIGPVSSSPIESGKFSSSDISNIQNVSREIDNMVSELANIEKYLNGFKI